MAEDEARQAARAVEEWLPHVDALPIDPRQYLLLAWDRWGVEMIREALGNLAAAGRPVPERLLQELTDWLARAEPYEDDDEVWRSEM